MIQQEERLYHTGNLRMKFFIQIVRKEIEGSRQHLIDEKTSLFCQPLNITVVDLQEYMVYNVSKSQNILQFLQRIGLLQKKSTYLSKIAYSLRLHKMKHCFTILDELLFRP